MKKTLLFSVIAALAFALVFTGCQQAVDYKLTVGHDSLPGPAEITATKYKGGVYLTWDMVENASGYEVWRQQVSPNKGSPSRISGDSALSRTSFSWRDVISGDNYLAKDADYEYTVVALSANATIGSAIGGEIVQNGKTTVGVRYEAEDLPAPAAYTLEPVTELTFKETLGGSLVVSWPGDANRLVRYQVKYNNASSETSITTRYTNGTSRRIENPQATTVVSVVKYLGGSSSTHEGNYDNYYAPSAAVSASHYIARYDGVTNLNSISGQNFFTAVRTDKDSVTLTLPVIQKNGTDVVPLTGYALAKAKLGVGSEIIGDWDDVTITNTLVKSLSVGGSTLPVYEFTDKEASEDFTWTYRLIVKLEGGKFYGLGYTTTTAATPQIEAFTVRTVKKTTSNIANTNYAVQTHVVNFKFEPEDGVTYTLQRKMSGDATGDTTVPGTHPWETITAAVTDSDATSPVKSRNLAYTIPAGSYRQKYLYQIVGTKAGALSRTGTITTTAPYATSETSGNNVTVYSAGPANSTTAWAPVDQLGLTSYSMANTITPTPPSNPRTSAYYDLTISGLINIPGGANNLLIQGEEIEIYAKESGGENYSLVGSITQKKGAPTGIDGGAFNGGDYYVDYLYAPGTGSLPSGVTLEGKVKTAK